MQALLLLLAVVLTPSSAFYAHSGDHSHGYHVHHFSVVPTSESPAGLANAMNGSLEITVHAGDVVIDFDLELKQAQWAEDAEIILEVDSFGLPTKTLPLFHRGYRGTASVSSKMGLETGLASVTFYEDGRASLTAATDGDVYDIELMEHKGESLGLKGNDAGHGMYMTRMSDFKTPYEKENKIHLVEEIRKYLKTRPSRRKLQQLQRFTNCFSGQNGQRAIKVGMVADASFQTVTGGASRASNAMVADLNRASDLIYEPQLRVWLLAGRIWTGNNVPGTSGCNVGTSARLTTFRDWRRSLGKDSHALVHLFTNCHPPPGTVGLAYVGVLCSHTYGTGWTNYMRNGGTWKVLAHELGHNFNAPHSFDNGQGRTGGIMDYGDGKFPAPGRAPSAQRAYAFNPLRKNDVCGGIQKSLNPSNTYLIPPNRCWTTFGGPAPTPTPLPTPRPQPVSQPTPRPTRRPTRRPTSGPPGGSTCTGLTMTWTFWIKRNNANCYWYRRAMQSFKPCIPQVTACSVVTDSRHPTWRKVTLKFVTSRAVYNSYNYQTWRNGIEAALKKFGITFYRRRLSATTGAPEPAGGGANETAGVPWITYNWVMNPNQTALECLPTCGEYRYRLESYVCNQTANNTRNGGDVNVLTVADDSCILASKPQVPIACAPSSCPANTCGNDVVDPWEMCDTKKDGCCAPGCQSFLATPACHSKNTKIDGTFMTCANDVSKKNCFLYIFQGEYFMKYTAVPGRESFYTPAWPNGAIKHQNTFQPKWTNLTAVAGGRNGEIWAFNGLDFLLIDYSDTSLGKVRSQGRVDTDWKAPAEFTKCGSVTAAERIDETILMLFCKNIYIHVNVVAEKANTTVYPADSLFASSGNVGVNAMYFDVRDSTFRIIRRNVQSIYRGANTPRTNEATIPNIFSTGVSSTSCAGDTECTQCATVNKCDKCNSGYKVLVNRCIPQDTLVDMTFTKGSKNDEFYSSDPILKTATFTTGHGNTPQSAMTFTPTTSVMARAPTLNGNLVKDFRVEVFYKPNTQSVRQQLVTIDSRFEIHLESVAQTQTMKLFVKFDKMTFDCYVMKPLTVGKWNLIAVEFANRQIITSANGFEHNRAFTQTAGSPPVDGLSFQNVTVGAKQNGLNGDLDSLQIKKVAVLQGNVLAQNNTTQPAWVIPIIIVASVLGCCLIAGITFLMVQRGMCCCGKRDEAGPSEVQTAFLSAQGTTGGGDYIAM